MKTRKQLLSIWMKNFVKYNLEIPIILYCYSYLYKYIIWIFEVCYSIVNK